MAIAIRGKRGLTRRQMLVRSASTVALAGFGGLAKPYLSRAADRPRIAGGIQSGDVATDSAVVWARADRPARMMVECSTVESFKTIVRASSVDALPDRDFTAKLLLEGLPSGQHIFYRVRLEDFGAAGLAGEAQVGHFRTAPTKRRSVSFVWSGDTAGQGWGIDPFCNPSCKVKPVFSRGRDVRFQGRSGHPKIECGGLTLTLSGHSQTPDGAMSPLRSAVSMPAGRDHRKPT